MVYGLVGLLIGALLLTYLTRGAEQTPGYENRQKKRDWKKHMPLSESEWPTQEDNKPTDYKKDV